MLTNNALLDDIEIEDPTTRGFIATWPNAEIRDDTGRVVWTLAGY